MNKIYYGDINETLYEYKHPSGLKVMFVPKRGFQKQFAVFSVDFGSVNTRFAVNSQPPVECPEGVAHFLEHKLFDRRDYSVMDRYAQLGASCNAATSFSRTYYYFTCTENFDQCLELLLDYVLHPDITEESVEKEKGIIIQEINMYLDNPEYIGSMNLFELMYHNNPIKKDIAGNEADVLRTTADILNMCHRTFYSPSNMALTVVGDLDEKRIEEIVNSGLEEFRPVSIERFFTPEPDSLAGTFKKVEMEVSQPIFNIGFKDDPEKFAGIDRIKREMAGSVLKGILFSKNSDFYDKLYNQGLINNTFYADYDIERQYALATISGESPDPQQTVDMIREYISQSRNAAFIKEDFEMTLNALRGDLIRRLNAPESFGKMLSSLYLQGISGFDYFTTCGKITLDDVLRVYDEVLLKDMAVSLVVPG